MPDEKLHPEVEAAILACNTPIFYRDLYRIALLAASKAREEYSQAEKKAARCDWLIHTANKEDIEATLLSREPWHRIEQLIDDRMRRGKP